MGGSRAWRRGRWAAGAAAGLLVLALAAWALAPSLLKAQIERRGSAALGRALTVAEVRVEPWALAVELHGLALAGLPGAAPTLQFGRLRADLSLESLWQRAPVLEALLLQGPVLRLVRRADGRLDAEDLWQRLAAASDASAEPARFALYNLSLDQGRVELDDRVSGQSHRIDGLRARLPFLSRLPADVPVVVEPALNFVVDGAAVNLSARTTPFADDRRSTLQLHLKDFALAPYWAYLPAATGWRGQDGHLDLDLSLSFHQPPGATPSVRLQGSAAVRGPALAQRAGPGRVGWRSLALQGADLQPLQRRLALASLRVEGLDIVPPQVVAASPAAEDGPAWQTRLDRLDAVDTRIAWRDAAPLDLVLPTLTAERLAWPATAASPFSAQALLSTQGRSLLRGSLQGEASPAVARLALVLDEAQLAPTRPWWPAWWPGGLSGRLSGRAELDWSADAGLRVAVPEARLQDLRAGGGAQPALRLAALDLADAKLDLPARRIEVGRVALRAPALRLQRARDGAWNLLAWLPPATPQSGPAAPAAAPWRWRLGSLQLRQGRLELDDAHPASPVQLAWRLDELQLLRLAGPAARTPVGVKLRSQIETPAPAGRSAAAPGRLDLSGQAGLSPMSLQAQVLAQRLPVHTLAPWFEELLPVELRHAELGYEGRLTFAQTAAGTSAAAEGALRVADLQLHERSTGDELLAWQSLTLAPLRAQLVPGSKPQLAIGRAELSDFASRLVITEQGRFNLREVAADPAAAASAPQAPAAAGLPLDLVIEETVFSRGRIDFRDRFIQPNYSADLSELNGRLGRFASGSTEMAALELRGRAAGTALLEVRGALNPTAEPLALDIAAKATDLELAPLSPYAGKYAGYAIERGKLSLDVSYRIEPDGRLAAKNQIVLNQLTFGERINSPEATSLPVRLAVALLTDRNGVIDLDLPLSGSVNDPQFSLFGLVLKVIGKLLVKAVTAPFALLAGGSGPDLSQLPFEPGSARFAPEGAQTLARAAKALLDRPALQLTITGLADPAEERAAMQAAALQTRLGEEQRRERARAGQPLAGDAPLPPLSVAERAALLQRLYETTPLPDRPRNLIGLLKTLPTAEVESRLRAATLVSTDTARDLALQRSLAVRNALAARGLPVDRLFLAAPRLRLTSEDDAAAWVPRAELSLAVR